MFDWFLADRYDIRISVRNFYKSSFPYSKFIFMYQERCQYTVINYTTIMYLLCKHYVFKYKHRSEFSIFGKDLIISGYHFFNLKMNFIYHSNIIIIINNQLSCLRLPKIARRPHLSIFFCFLRDWSRLLEFFVPVRTDVIISNLLLLPRIGFS